MTLLKLSDAGWDSASKRLSGRRRFGVVWLQLKALVFLSLPSALAGRRCQESAL